jgi:hypothetical protein
MIRVACLLVLIPAAPEWRTGNSLLPSRLDPQGVPDREGWWNKVTRIHALIRRRMEDLPREMELFLRQGFQVGGVGGELVFYSAELHFRARPEHRIAFEQRKHHLGICTCLGEFAALGT